MTSPHWRGPRGGEDDLLIKEVIEALSSVPASHPAAQAFNQREPLAAILRLLVDDPRAYSGVLKAIMARNHRVLNRQNTH
jgi:hypothetical protein